MLTLARLESLLISASLIPASSVVEEDTALEDLGLDSLDAIEVCMVIEEDLECDIDDTVLKITPETTAGELVEKINTYLADA